MCLQMKFFSAYFSYVMIVFLSAVAVCSSETLICTYKSTRRLTAEHRHEHLHCRKNLKSHD